MCIRDRYNNAIRIQGDAQQVLEKLIGLLKAAGKKKKPDWLAACTEKRVEWETFKVLRYEKAGFEDPKRGKVLMAEPAAIKKVCLLYTSFVQKLLDLLLQTMFERVRHDREVQRRRRVFRQVKEPRLDTLKRIFETEIQDFALGCCKIPERQSLCDA